MGRAYWVEHGFHGRQQGWSLGRMEKRAWSPGTQGILSSPRQGPGAEAIMTPKYLFTSLLACSQF